jgi:hypothetical protein
MSEKRDGKMNKMKKRQYRLKEFKYDNSLYTVEVRFKGLFFWSNWYRIGTTPYDDDFGLYGSDTAGYPHNKTECEKIIEKFDKWYVIENTIKKVKYIDIGVYE